uniref:C-type lectin domain-containing protein n=1 Tax=Chelydra serpentina TaxID=8475 RepID=A0A8C3SM33_CHESE
MGWWVGAGLPLVKGNVSRHKLSFSWCGGCAVFHGVMSLGLVAMATEGDVQISHPVTFSSPAKNSEPCPADPASPVAACPDGWIGYLGKCYYFSQAEGNWNNSQNNCSALGASLAGIDTQALHPLSSLPVPWGLSGSSVGLIRRPSAPGESPAGESSCFPASLMGQVKSRQ